MQEEEAGGKSYLVSTLFLWEAQDRLTQAVCKHGTEMWEVTEGGIGHGTFTALKTHMNTLKALHPKVPNAGLPLLFSFLYSCLLGVKWEATLWGDNIMGLM